MFRLPIVIFGALAIAIASLLVARAADAADDQFVNSLAAQGITGDRGTIIAAGHTVCDDIARVASTAPGLRSNRPCSGPSRCRLFTERNNGDRVR
jgi:hypothetical protein